MQGRRERTGVELRWRPGPFSVKSEYMRVATERRGQSVEDTNLSPLLATGWYISSTWAVTGENKAGGLNKPRRPFLRGGFGALEVAVRLEGLAFSSAGSDGLSSFSVRADVVEVASNHSNNRRELVPEPVGQDSTQRDQGNARKRARGARPSRIVHGLYVTRFQFTL